MMFVGLLLVMQFACALPSDDAEAEDIGSHGSAVVDGSEAPKKYNFAVAVANAYSGICSGTLIAPNLVLTARQCVIAPSDIPRGGPSGLSCAEATFPEDDLDPSQLFVTASVEAKPNGRSKFYFVKKVFTPTERAWCGNDIALLELEGGIPASEAQPATPVVRFSLSDPSKVGRTVTAVGYGRTNPAEKDAGIRRIRADVEILCIPGDESYDCDPAVDQREFVTDGYVCAGADSGSGPYQVTPDDGTMYVLGVLSRTDTNCRNGVYTRTDAHGELIIAAGLEAAAEGGYQTPRWAVPDVNGNGCGGEDCAPKIVQRRVTQGCSAMPRAASPSTFDWLALAGVALVLRRRKRGGRSTTMTDR